MKYRFVVILILFFLLMSYLGSFLQDILLEDALDSNYWIFGVKAVFKLATLVVLIFIIYRQDLLEFNFSSIIKSKSWITKLKTTIIIVLSISYVLITYWDAGVLSIALIIIATFFSALSEEMTFRGIVLPALIRKNQKTSIIKPVLISSGLFGLLHYVNVLSQPNNFLGITFQVLAAVTLGILLCYLILKIRNIYIIGLFHASVNLVLNQNTLFNFEKALEEKEKLYSNDLLSSLLILALLALIGYIFINKIMKINPETIRLKKSPSE